MQNFDSIIQQTWTDENFKTRLLNFPNQTFIELGYSFGEDVTIEVHDDSADLIHFVLLEEGQARSVNIMDDPTIGKVMSRAYSDIEYKGRLLKNSNSAIKEVLGVEPPLNVQVHENSASTIHIVLPANPDLNGELSDSDLAIVSGGKGLNINCDTVSSFIGKAGSTSSKFGSFVNDTLGVNNFGTLFTSLGPLLVGGGQAVTTVSGFFAGKTAEAA